jgi:hypothetical protein
MFQILGFLIKIFLKIILTLRYAHIVLIRIIFFCQPNVTYFRGKMHLAEGPYFRLLDTKAQIMKKPFKENSLVNLFQIPKHETLSPLKISVP